MLRMKSIPVNASKAVVAACADTSMNGITDKYGIPFLYHITHINNLQSILSNGLLSHNLAHQKCKLIDISDLDVNARRALKHPVDNRSLHDYVPTYFNPLNPMSYRLREQANDFIILKLNSQLLLQSGMLFTEGNAACCKTRFFNELNDLNQIPRDLTQPYWHQV